MKENGPARILRSAITLVVLTTLAFLISTQGARGQSSSWAHTWGGVSNDNAWGVAVDGANFIYVAGQTSSIPYGQGDFLLTKFDNQGGFQWAKEWSLGVAGTVGGVGATPSGDIIIAGNTGGDGVVMRVDGSGSVIWTTKWPASSANVKLHGPATDVDNNTYVCGGTDEQLAWFKFDATGHVTWVRRWGTARFGTDMALDNSGDLFLTGYTYPGDDAVFMRINPIDGVPVFIRTWGGSGQDDAEGVAPDGNGNVYVTGLTTSFGAGGWDIFLLKYDANGNLLWQRTWGGSGTDMGWKVSTGAGGRIFVTGYTTSFGAGDADLVLLEYDAAGTLLSQRVWGGIGFESGNDIKADTSGEIFIVGTAPNNLGTWRDVDGVQAIPAGASVPHNWTRDTLIGTGQPIEVHEVSYSGVVDVGGGGQDVFVAKCAPAGPSLRWPLAGSLADRVITLPFGANWPVGDCPPGTPKLHTGIDIRAHIGEPVYAAESGTVKAIVDGTADGNACAVTIEHAGFTTVCWHIDTAVTTHQLVVKGQYIGKVADLGANTHLHFGVRLAPYSDVSYRGALPVSACAGYPAFPDGFTDPAQLTYESHDPCGDLVFRAVPNGWNFPNTQANMWPQSWWQQFNYSEPQYPFAWRFLCKSSDFPDWPLFVSAFGENQCYIDPPPAITVYRPWAVARWLALKRAWPGSCFGFATSSFLLYDGKINLSSEFPGRTTLYDVQLSDQGYKPRTMVNKYFLYQFGKSQQQYINASRKSVTPLHTLQDCQAMFASATRDDRILAMWNNHGGGAHAINPYRCEVDAAHPETTRVYVYDNKVPGNDNLWVSINTVDTTWGYQGRPGWGGDKWLFLMDPVSNYMTNPVLPSSIPPRERWITRPQATAPSYVEVYVPPSGNARLESALGSIGRVGDSLFSDLTDGMPITPITGQETPPIGYFLPDGVWTITLSGRSDSLQRLSLFTDSTVLVYSRSLRDTIRNEQVRYLGDARSLWVLNPDTASRPYDIEVISTAPDSEVVCKIGQIGIASDDSALYSITPGSGLIVENHGHATTYDLSVEIASAMGDTVFAHRGVVIDGGSAHKIVPDWRPYGDSVLILVDTGFTGTFNDTVLVENQGLCDCPHQGDVNSDGVIDVFDVIGVIGIAFSGETDPKDASCPKTRGDVDNNGVTDVFDVIYLIATAFSGGPNPVNPCGP